MIRVVDLGKSGWGRVVPKKRAPALGATGKGAQLKSKGMWTRGRQQKEEEWLDL